MPSIYLSPSTQEFNPFVTGGNEEYYMNLIADVMMHYLQQYGITYGRNTPDMTAGSSIRESNAGNYDLHLAIHSNASSEWEQGQNRGVIIFYYPSSAEGKRFSEILQNNMKKIYSVPGNIRIVPTTSLGEVSRTTAPAVLIEVAYHDNVEDAEWIKNNIELLGETIAMSVVEFFNAEEINYKSLSKGNIGKMRLRSRYINVKCQPLVSAPVIGMIPDEAEVLILNEVGDWYNILYNDINGYVYKQYIILQ